MYYLFFGFPVKCLSEPAKIYRTVISQWGDAQRVGLADHIFVSSGHFRQERYCEFYYIVVSFSPSELMTGRSFLVQRDDTARDIMAI